MVRYLIFVIVLGFLSIGKVSAFDVNRIEPAFWWTDMKNPNLQILVHGENIAESMVSINYPGVKIKEVVRLENSNYLFVYLNISQQAKPGVMNLEFINGKQKLTKPFELKPRNKKPGAKGFSPSDVMYLITPDRFANGDASNDNLEGASVNRERPGSRHGGDLKGIINNLDYLQDLGITTVWLNPVQKNGPNTYHGYAITDFYNVDPRFGTNSEYVEMVDKAHDRGLKVVMDMIFNHCGIGHWWMTDRPSADWLNNPDANVFTTHFKWSLIDIHAPESEKDQLVNGWFSRGMPDLNQKNPHLATYLIQNSIWWIEYARIDGIRQDTHPYADYDFMTRWCKEVLDEYPDFNIVGEAWYPRGTASAWWQRNSKNNERNTNLKTVMDFDLTFTCQKAFTDESSSKEGSEAGLFKIYEVIAQDFLFADPNNILTFLDNHDLPRFLKAGETDLRRYKQALAFLLTTRGIPQIYYGTEVLLSTVNQQKKQEVRADFPGGWKEDSVSFFVPSGRNQLQNEAFNYAKTLLNWRKSSKPVIEGSLIHYTPDNSGCYIYARIKDNKTVLMVMNGTDKSQKLQMNRFREVIKTYNTGKDVVTGQTFNISTELEIGPRDVYILELL